MSENKNIKQGYKHTAIGILPKDWEVVRLGEVCEFLKGKGISKDDLADNGILCIRYGELYTTYNEIIQKVVSRTNLDSGELVFSKANDIILPTSVETAIDICKASCVMIDNVALGGDSNILRSKQNGAFLSYYINHIAKYDIAKLAQGVSIVHLYASELKSLQIPLPPLKEQEKIAQILSAWDNAIATLDSLIKAKQHYKKALMQRLLTPHTHPLAPSAREGGQEANRTQKAPPLAGGVGVGYPHTNNNHNGESLTPSLRDESQDSPKQSTNPKMDCHESRCDSRNDDTTLNCHDLTASNLAMTNPAPRHCEALQKPKQSTQSLRFAGFADKWQEFRLGDIGEIKKGEQLNKLSLSDDANGKFAVINGGILPLGYTDKFNSHENTITISEGGNCGFVNLIREKFWSGGHCYTILDSKVDTFYLYYFLKFKEKFIQQLSVGSALKNIQKKDIEKFKVFIPALAEQKKIAQVLSVCDKEIAILDSKLQCLKTQKRGLMQQLLSGKVRVKI